MLSLSFKSVIILNLKLSIFYQFTHSFILFSTEEFRSYQTCDYINKTILHHVTKFNISLDNNAEAQWLVVSPTIYCKITFFDRLHYTAINKIFLEEEWCLSPVRLFHWIPESSVTMAQELKQSCNWIELGSKLTIKNTTDTITETYIISIFYHKIDDRLLSEFKTLTSTCHLWELKLIAEKINFLRNKCWVKFDIEKEFNAGRDSARLVRELANCKFKIKNNESIEMIEKSIVNNETFVKYSNNQLLPLKAAFPQPPMQINAVFDFCGKSFDSISQIRGELFVFKNQYAWRFRERLRLFSGHPIMIKDIFPFPKSFTGIDAAFEDQKGNIYFFSGQQIFIYDGNHFLNKWPRTLKDLNIDATISKIDAAFIWRKNNNIYIFIGTKFWRFNSKTFQIDPGYPKEINHWKGVPYPIDAVMQWKDGVTYFFVGNIFYRFNDKKVHIETGPLSIKEHWFHLPNNFKCPSSYGKQLNTV